MSQPFEEIFRFKLQTRINPYSKVNTEHSGTFTHHNQSILFMSSWIWSISLDWLARRNQKFDRSLWKPTTNQRIKKRRQHNISSKWIYFRLIFEDIVFAVCWVNFTICNIEWCHQWCASVDWLWRLRLRSSWRLEWTEFSRESVGRWLNKTTSIFRLV